MLRAEPANRHVHDRHIDESKDPQRRGQHLRLASGGEPPQHQVADINEPQHQRCSQPRIPCPPDAPHRTRPDWPGDENDGAEHNTNFCTCCGQCVSVQIALPQVHNGRQEVDEEAHARNPRRGHVIVKDALHVAHGLLRRSHHQRLIGAEAQQGQRENDKCNRKIFHRFLLATRHQPLATHSAFKTVSNRRRHTSVNTTS